MRTFQEQIEILNERRKLQEEGNRDNFKDVLGDLLVSNNITHEITVNGETVTITFESETPKDVLRLIKKHCKSLKFNDLVTQGKNIATFTLGKRQHRNRRELEEGQFLSYYKLLIKHKYADVETLLDILEDHALFDLEFHYKGYKYDFGNPKFEKYLREVPKNIDDGFNSIELTMNNKCDIFFTIRNIR